MRSQTEPRRQPVRLKDHDYSQPGAYFVTLTTQHRFCAFGAITDGVMNLNPIGQMVDRWWREIPRAFPRVGVDIFAIMPNHVHGIVIIETVPVVGADLCVCPNAAARPGTHANGVGAHTGAPLQPRGRNPTSLPRIIQWFKTMTTNEYIRGVRQYAWPDFPGHFWQRSYYERIIRNASELTRIRRYILDNPTNWQQDKNFRLNLT
ncbi:MAG: transposase [candidate division WOR-3 bacterium]